MPAHVPQILINREPLNHVNFDVELLGNCDDIVNELSRRLGPPWSAVCESDRFPALREVTELPTAQPCRSCEPEKPGAYLACGNTCYFPGCTLRRRY